MPPPAEGVAVETVHDDFRTDASADKYGLGRQNPLMMLNELTMKMGRKCEVKAYDLRTELGFRAEAIIDGVALTSVYAPNSCL